MLVAESRAKSRSEERGTGWKLVRSELFNLSTCGVFSTSSASRRREAVSVIVRRPISLSVRLRVSVHLCVRASSGCKGSSQGRTYFQPRASSVVAYSVVRTTYVLFIQNNYAPL